MRIFVFFIEICHFQVFAKSLEGSGQGSGHGQVLDPYQVELPASRVEEDSHSHLPLLEEVEAEFEPIDKLEDRTTHGTTTLEALQKASKLGGLNDFKSLPNLFVNSAKNAINEDKSGNSKKLLSSFIDIFKNPVQKIVKNVKDNTNKDMENFTLADSISKVPVVFGTLSEIEEEFEILDLFGLSKSSEKDSYDVYSYDYSDDYGDRFTI